MVEVFVADQPFRKKKGKEEVREPPPPPEVLQRAVQRLHDNLGHCSGADLVRVLIHGGASEEALKEVEHLVVNHAEAL